MKIHHWLIIFGLVNPLWTNPPASYWGSITAFILAFIVYIFDSDIEKPNVNTKSKVSNNNENEESRRLNINDIVYDKQTDKRLVVVEDKGNNEYMLKETEREIYHHKNINDLVKENLGDQ